MTWPAGTGTPTTASTVYAGPITVTQTTTIKAVAGGTGLAVSDATGTLARPLGVVARVRTPQGLALDFSAGITFFFGQLSTLLFSLGSHFSLTSLAAARRRSSAHLPTPYSKSLRWATTGKEDATK